MTSEEHDEDEDGEDEDGEDECDFGETVWDEAPRHELLRETQRFYAALVNARGALKMCRYATPGPYWGPAGTGGEALAKIEHALAPYDGESGFFRYAVDLLFPGMGVNCSVCDNPKCAGAMQGSPLADGPGQPREPACSRPCLMCDGPMRPIEWSDLEPVRPRCRKCGEPVSRGDGGPASRLCRDCVEDEVYLAQRRELRRLEREARD